MKLFGKKKEQDVAAAAVPQTSPKYDIPINFFNGYGSSYGEYMLYKSLREAVPIIDAAICKLVRLTTKFSLECTDKSVEVELNRFAESVKVGAAGWGIGSFVSAYLDQLLTYGTAVGEMVVNSSCTDILGLYNAGLSDVELIPDENPMLLKVCRRVNGIPVPVKNQQLVLASLLNAEPGTCKGTSLLRGLPFISSILMNIFNSIGMNWERMGNLRYAVVYKPEKDSIAQTNAKEKANIIAKEWAATMNSDSVRDFVAVGDVDIRVIGADSQILDSEVPVRQILEQIIAKTGLPPFLLGLSWSSTERMSEQQADILTSELEYYRRVLEPVILQICSLWMRLHGYSARVRVNWADINLQDAVELARARLYNAQAAELEKQTEGGDLH